VDIAQDLAVGMVGMMGLRLSKRSEFIQKAEIRTMTVECDQVRGINLAQGVCDTGVPECVIHGVHEAIAQGLNSYTRHDGLAVLREAIARKLARENGIRMDPETEVVVSAGSTGAFYCACLALLDPGDEVVLFEPYYGYHLNTLEAAEAIPRYVAMQPAGWTFTRADLERAITPHTRGMMVCTPSNPCGKVFSREELETIAAVAEAYDLFVFTDEIYEYILFDGATHVSPASIPGLRDRTITIGGYSKTYSITGWRIGYAACAAKWAERIGYLNDLVYVCAPAPLQYGVAKGIEMLGPEFYGTLQRDYARKREMICSALTRAGLTPWVPRGAYYVLADASKLPGSTSKAKAMYLLEKTGVASVPGEAFYHDDQGEQILRFCFAKQDDVLREACRRLGRL
jgi:aminotransferase